MQLTAISNIKKENIIFHEPKESKVKDSKKKKHFMLKTSWEFVKIHLENEYGADLASSLSLRLCFKQVEYTKGEKMNEKEIIICTSSLCEVNVFGKI